MASAAEGRKEDTTTKEISKILVEVLEKAKQGKDWVLQRKQGEQ